MGAGFSRPAVMITIHLPAMLRHGGPDTIVVPEPVATLADVIDLLDARIPDFRTHLDQGILSFAVNDEMLLVRLRQHPLKDGDRIEIIPTISGGQG